MIEAKQLRTTVTRNNSIELILKDLSKFWNKGCIRYKAVEKSANFFPCPLIFKLKTNMKREGHNNIKKNIRSNGSVLLIKK